jgi:flagellar hook-length control protein FliK
MSVASSIRLATKVPNTVEAATTANKLGETVFEQIDPRILELTAATHRDNERRTLKMRLNPAELGTIEITVEKSSTGKVNVHFKTERQETRQILNDSLVNLRDSLERSGTNVGDVDITCSSFASNGNESRGERPQTFGTTENQPVGTANFDGISQHEDDKDDRLVNLRA